MGWLTESFEQHTAAWILISSLIGGVVGSSVKFVFEDLLRPVLGSQREARALRRRYATPLVRSAESLERRLNNLFRNAHHDWYGSSDYYRISTLYAFAEHLAWIRIVEEEFGFLPFESSKQGRQFNDRLNGIFRALSSFAYFRWSSDEEGVAASQVPRLMLTAAGESMIGPGGDRPRRFTEFAVQHAEDAQFRRWFDDLDRCLAAASAGRDDLAWDRLIAAAANLRGLIRLLDPKGSLVPLRRIANLSLVRHAKVRDLLIKEFDDLVRDEDRAAPGPGRASEDRRRDRR